MKMYEDLKKISESKNDKVIGQIIKFAIYDYIAKSKLKGWL